MNVLVYRKINEKEELFNKKQKKTAHLKYMLDCMTYGQGYWRRKTTLDTRNIIAFW